MFVWILEHYKKCFIEIHNTIFSPVKTVIYLIGFVIYKHLIYAKSVSGLLCFMNAQWFKRYSIITNYYQELPITKSIGICHDHYKNNIMLLSVSAG